MKTFFHIILGLLGLIFSLFYYLISRLKAGEDTGSKKLSDERPWLEDFIILYVNKCLLLDADMIDFHAVFQGRFDFSRSQSLLVYLKAYLRKLGVEYSSSDYEVVMREFSKVISIHTTGFFSESSVRSFCEKEGASGEEVESLISMIETKSVSDEELHNIRKELFIFRFKNLFLNRYGSDFWSYTEDMLEENV